MLYIIARPKGSRRYKYWKPSSYKEDRWVNMPGVAYGFPDRETAELYISSHSKKIHPDEDFEEEDFVRPFNNYDGKHCQFCNSNAIRVIGTAIESPEVTLDYECGGCGQLWSDYYRHNSTQFKLRP